MSTVDSLRTILSDLTHITHGVDVAELGLRDQLAVLEYANRIRSTASDYAGEADKAITTTRAAGDTPEAGGWVAEIRSTPRYTKWRHDDLRRDIRSQLVDYAETELAGLDPVDAVLAAYDLLTDAEEGLQPINSAMRLTPLREVWGMDPADYATKTEGLKTRIVRKPEG